MDLRSKWKAIGLGVACLLAAALAWKLVFAAGDRASPAAHLPPGRCVPGEWAACDAEGLRVEWFDPPTAAAYYALACTAGHPPACTHEGAMLEAGDRIDEAKALYDAACTKGDLLGCIALGSLYERGADWRIVKDYGKSIALYKRACDEGEGLGCVGLAEMREKGRDLSPNYLKITALYVKGCEKKNMLACWRLSQRYRDTKGGAKKLEQKAAELQARACAGGIDEACAPTAASSAPAAALIK